MELYRLSDRKGICISSDGRDDYGKLINAVRKRRIQFYGLCYRDGRLYGYIRSRDMDKLCSISHELGYECTVTDVSGLRYQTSGYSRRFGLPVGFLLSLLTVAFLADRVMMIEIGGNENIPDEKILTLLSTVGIYTGSSISSVDLREAERDILSMEKDIAWIGIRHSGSRVVVEVDELKEIPEMERKNTPCNIIASHDAQIKSVRLYSGMLIPMVGDAVRKGDVIVSGVVETKYGRSFYVHSIAEITGEYTEKMTFSVPLQCEEMVDDGEKNVTAVSLFGKRIIMPFSEKISGYHEYSEEETFLKLGRITFPISKITMHYRLKKPVIVTRTEDEAERLLTERMKRYEQNFYEDGLTVLDREIEKYSDGKNVSLAVTYKVEGEIGSEQQFFAKYEGVGEYIENEQTEIKE